MRSRWPRNQMRYWFNPQISQISQITMNVDWRMRSLYLSWTEGIQKLTQAVAEFDGENLPLPVAEIPWVHNILLLGKLKSSKQPIPGVQKVHISDQNAPLISFQVQLVAKIEENPSIKGKK
jgi:hypothetical protein